LSAVILPATATEAVSTRVLEAHLAGFGQDEIDTLKGYLGRMIDHGQAKGDNRALSSGRKS
jgi:hypothetical protein